MAVIEAKLIGESRSDGRRRADRGGLRGGLEMIFLARAFLVRCIAARIAARRRIIVSAENGPRLGSDKVHAQTGRVQGGRIRRVSSKILKAVRFHSAIGNRKRVQ